MKKVSFGSIIANLSYAFEVSVTCEISVLWCLNCNRFPFAVTKAQKVLKNSNSKSKANIKVRNKTVWHFLSTRNAGGLSY